MRDAVTGIQVRGWAIDPQTAAPVQVQIRRNGVLVATIRADQHRDDLGDVAHHYGTAHGFRADIPAEPGRNRVCVRILGVGAGGDRDAGCADIEHATPTVKATPAPAGGHGALVPALPPAVEDVTSLAPLVDQVVDAVVDTAATTTGTAVEDLLSSTLGR